MSIIKNSKVYACAIPCRGRWQIYCNYKFIVKYFDLIVLKGLLKIRREIKYNLSVFFTRLFVVGIKLYMWHYVMISAICQALIVNSSSVGTQSRSIINRVLQTPVITRVTTIRIYMEQI
jgi:hypothetical protein